MMVTTYDDEDIDRCAASLRQEFNFSTGSNHELPSGTFSLDDWNKIAAGRSRNDSLRLSRKAARTMFESMGAQYMPSAKNAAA